MKHLGKRMTSLCLTAALLSGMLPVSAWAQTSSQQAAQGTEENPYQIAAASDLALLETYPDAYFELTADLDLSGVSFAPLDPENGFTGTLDGDGHSIKNLTVEDDYAALFVKIANGGTNEIGVVQNLTFVSPDIKGKTGAAVVAYANEGYLKNISVTGGSVAAEGTDKASGTAGALVALQKSGAVRQCVSTASVTANVAGGLVGLMQGGELSNCYAGGKVAATGTDADAGAVFGYTKLSSFTCSNVLFGTDATAQAAAGQDADGAFSLKGLIGVSVSAPPTVQTGDAGESMATFSRAPADGVVSYSSGSGTVLSVDETSGAWSAAAAGTAAYNVIFTLGANSYTLSAQVQVTQGTASGASSSVSSQSESSSAAASSSSEAQGADTSSQSAASGSESTQASSAASSDNAASSESASNSASASPAQSASSDSASSASTSSQSASGEAASSSEANSASEQQEASEPEQVNGSWETVDGQTYYVYNDGTHAVGPQLLDGVHYIFDENGAVKKFSFFYGDSWYLASSSGALYADCFLKRSGSTTYYGADGAAKLGFFTDVDGTIYYQLRAENGRYILAVGPTVIDGKTYYFSASGAQITSTGWTSDGVYLENGVVASGVRVLDGKTYVLNEVGKPYTGEFTYSGVSYCADGAGVVYLDAFRTLGDGTLRYYDASGAAVTGWFTHSGGRYYQTPALTVLTGRQTVGGQTYFFGSDGRLAETDGWAGDYYVQNGTALTGRQTLSGSDYIFGDNGLVLKGAFVYENAHYYGDDTTGALVKNGIAGSGAGSYYGADGTAAQGWAELNGAKYYQNGALQLVTGKQVIDGTTYFFENDGKLQTKDGWADSYYVKNGTYATGKQTIEGKPYIFSDSGSVYKNEFVYGGKYYYASGAGVLYTNYIRTLSDGSLRFYGEDGAAPTGWISFGGKKYYQSEALVLLTGTQKIDGTTYYFTAGGAAVTEGWVGTYYVRDGKAVTGPQKIDGKYYIFSDLGIAYKYEFVYDNCKYLANAGGVLYTNCFLSRGGNLTYFGMDGAARTGWVQRPNGTRYYQTEAYVLLTGQQVVDGVTYFFGSDGALSTTDGWAGDYYVKDGAALTGKQTIGGKQYIFGDDGLVLKGEFVWKNAQYEANASGALYADAVRTRADGTLRYYGADGAAPTGWVDAAAGRYYQSKALVLAVGKQSIDGTVYYFAANGLLKTDDGWAGDYYVKDGAALTGAQTLEGVLYLFDGDGKVYKGDFTYEGGTYYGDEATGAVLRDGIHTRADGTLRYHDADGKAVSGWFDYQSGRYYQTQDFILLTGKQTIDGALYFFESSGALKTGDGWAGDYYLRDGQVLTGAQTLDGKRYIFGEDGAVRKEHFQYQGAWYCADNAGALYTKTIRTLATGGLRYFGETGAAAVGWAELNGKRYYQNAQFRLVTGRQSIEDKIYFFDEEGALITGDGWVDGYYLKDGEAVTGAQTIDGKLYVFDETGLVKTGEFQYGSAWYWADEKGVLAVDTVKTRADGSMTYYDKTGAALAGWLENETGAQYYQTASSAAPVLAKGFVTIGDDIYYFLSNGRLFSGNAAGWYTIGDKQCYLLTDGRYCASPKITAVTTAYDSAKKVYVLTVENTISSAAGAHTAGSFSFDGGLTWQASNTRSYDATKGVSLGGGTILVRDGVGQAAVYTSAISLSPVGGALSGSNRGIDVSMYNGNINWTQVAKSGVSFALIRAMSYNNAYGGYYIDPYFETNVRNAKAAGLNVGVYLFSYATSVQDMINEVNFFLNSSALASIKASGIKFDYPVYIDYESSLNLSGTDYNSRTYLVRLGMQLLEKAGYYPGFYTYHSYMQYFDCAGLANEGYAFWYARYPASPNPDSNPSSTAGASVGIWQYCSDGNTNPAMTPYVYGVSTRLDLNVTYVDYPTKVHQFSGQTTNVVTPVEQDTLTVYDSQSGKVVTDATSTILAKIVQTEVGGFGNAEVYKAQAVAAHSWILYQLQTGNSAPTVSLATSVSSAVTSAVKEVSNRILTYGGTVANTMYGAANSGTTQSAANMWGSNLAYLAAGIESPGDLSATVYTSGGTAWYNRSATVRLATMTSNIEKMVPGSTSGRTDYENWITNPVYDANGYLLTIDVMGRTLKAGRFYDNCWGLYSPNFTMTYNGNGTWTFVTRGNGHCVGMSQWGAYGYARQGYAWDWILQHYYPGTTLGTN